MKFKNIWILAIIVFLSLVLRIWQIDKAPAGFNADEAAIGYNAYSILKTGKDEYGQVLPLAFKSFGDYKPGLYFYFVIPFVVLFGLSEIAVRLPSIFLGIATVFLIYILAKKIFNSEGVGLITALLLSISPWHIHFSRGGWESNAATFFITLGVWIFLKSLDNIRFLIWSLGSFLISMYLYQSPRLIAPVLILGFALFYWRYFRHGLKHVLFAFIIILIFCLPLLFQFSSGEASSRFSGLSFLSDLGPQNRLNQLRGEHQDLGNFQARLLHNKLTAYIPNLVGHYLDHFSADFLFINGDSIIRDKVPEVGQFYLVESLFLIVGFISLIRSRFHHARILILWILVAPLASSITFQTPNAVRSLNMVVPMTMVMGYGLWVIKVQSAKFKVQSMILLIYLFLSFEVIHYLDSYYIHYPKRTPLAFEYGFSEMVAKLQKYEGVFDKVVITDRYDQPYILVLFYKKYDPSKYQTQAQLTPRDKFNFGTVRSFDKYQFRSVSPDELKYSQNTLFVGTDKEIPKDANIIDQVKFPNGESAFIFVKT